ncbi:FbpB family small basic protein [Ornithinibacillus sp. L9]|uniref:FbpB family small basic protein n=1 Tax=Ornithinibacillus caprae TaxID=2678566 RepID=A0A6N8FPR7_9BACI|nr:FbpB family small basic protein [Ornithinibacillus caprae]MUK90167.1 FbpB family small basic protein [Ornithinibacillus caprae]
MKSTFKVSYEELVRNNKEEIMKDKKYLSKLEERIEQRIEGSVQETKGSEE